MVLHQTIFCTDSGRILDAHDIQSQIKTNTM